MANTERIDAALIALGCNPLNAEQIECINDAECADDALGMLDDLIARVGVSAEACAPVIAAINARA